MQDHPVLASVARNGIRLGLDRMRRFLRSLGSPERAFPAVHVAGTNGKGSVCFQVAEMLKRRGFRVGLYTSPHVQRVNERIRVDGVEVGDRVLAALLDELDAARVELAHHMDDLGVEGEPLTYFEIMTAAAFLHFQRSNIDVGVIEVGMGGRLDATNLVGSVVSVITSIGLDHTEVLGPDLPSIAAEKAGVLKPAVPAIVGAVPPAALRVIRTMAGELSVPLYVYGEQFRVLGDNRSFTWRSSSSTLQDLQVAMAGDHQLHNAAVAVAVAELLPAALSCDEASIRAGLANAQVPGRMEWVAPDMLVDCAHNPDGAQVLANYLKGRERSRSRTLLLGASKEKDIHAIGAILAPQVNRIYTTACSHPRAMAPGDVAAALEGLSVPVMPAGRIEEALPLARSHGGELVVAGSIFLVGAVRDLLGLR